jgi:hypothetical protein
VGSCDIQGLASGVAVAGSYAYVTAMDRGLSIVDTSDPAAPRAVGSTITPGYALGVAAIGNTVYVADDQGGLLILRFTPP